MGHDQCWQNNNLFILLVQNKLNLFYQDIKLQVKLSRYYIKKHKNALFLFISRQD